MLHNAPLEPVARQWRAEGYSANVAARRLIEEHGMTAEDAIALVQRAYETKRAVRPYRGDMAAAVLSNLGIVTLGVAMAAWSFLHRASFPHSLFRYRWPMYVATGALIAAAGLVRLARARPSG